MQDTDKPVNIDTSGPGAEIELDSVKEELIEETQKQAVAFSKGPTNAYGSVKKLLNQTFSNGLETQMEREGIYISENAQSDNGQEGMLAFKEKRKALFK